MQVVPAQLTNIDNNKNLSSGHVFDEVQNRFPLRTITFFFQIFFPLKKKGFNLRCAYPLQYDFSWLTIFHSPLSLSLALTRTLARTHAHSRTHPHSCTHSRTYSHVPTRTLAHSREVVRRRSTSFRASPSSLDGRCSQPQPRRA